jgi:hypothetical protein
MSNSFWQRIIGGLFVLAFVSALVGLLFSWGNATALTTVVVVLTGAFVLVWVSPRIAEFTLSLTGVSGKLSELESDIAKLYALSMSNDAFYQLKKLSTNSFGHFWLDPDLRVGLAHELMYFKVLGYIEFNEKLVKDKDERNLPKGDHPNDDLSHYISVTKQGLDFIDLRERALKQAPKNA